MPRPFKLDEPSRRRVLRRVLAGDTLRQAARSVGCTDRTVQREALRDDVFAWRLAVSRSASQTLDARPTDDPHLQEVFSMLAARLAALLRERWGDLTPTADGATTCDA